jgi:hypothetical protein
MFVHWKVTGLPRETKDWAVADTLARGTTVEHAVSGGFDAQGRLGLTVYFPNWLGDSSHLRAGLVQSYQALLRSRLQQPNLTIEDVTKR